jgi:hypothetical protein
MNEKKYGLMKLGKIMNIGNYKIKKQ